MEKNPRRSKLRGKLRRWLQVYAAEKLCQEPKSPGDRDSNVNTGPLRVKIRHQTAVREDRNPASAGWQSRPGRVLIEIDQRRWLWKWQATSFSPQFTSRDGSRQSGEHTKRRVWRRSLIQLTYAANRNFLGRFQPFADADTLGSLVLFLEWSGMASRSDNNVPVSSERNLSRDIADTSLGPNYLITSHQGLQPDKHERKLLKAGSHAVLSLWSA
ncbi:hypothetical protein CIRG_09535 [Coccidioides immitis RMSCC 2394]|uniref:Uncharacterized protein n=1 Tax=Coccidioides immitis RMSCC 2394 TaxID=404692 RepID=A0A0J6YL34_COCIT|nr:hypothetical protein CIRG_09535 [Coccidioides immitis RMSCC 2394]